MGLRFGARLAPGVYYSHGARRRGGCSGCGAFILALLVVMAATFVVHHWLATLLIVGIPAAVIGGLWALGRRTARSRMG